MTDFSLQSEGTAGAFLAVAARELKMLDQELITKIPVSCMVLIKANPGNDCCADCGKKDPLHASISYGTLHCDACAQVHMKFVRRSRVIALEEASEWSRSDIIMMLEGGNKQAVEFLKKHSTKIEHRLLQITLDVNGNGMNNDITIPAQFKKYRTKAARYFRQQLLSHVNSVIDSGMYHGRSIIDDEKRSDTSSKSLSKNINTVIRKSSLPEKGVKAARSQLTNNEAMLRRESFTKSVDMV